MAARAPPPRYFSDENEKPKKYINVMFPFRVLFFTSLGDDSSK